MVVQHNMAAMNAGRNLNVIVGKNAKTTEKLSSGYRINRAADDAAGLTISEKMRIQIRGNMKASQNAQDGISLLQVADGALQEHHSVLQRMRELSVQAANDTETTLDRAAVGQELRDLSFELDRITNTTSFNEIPLIDAAGLQYSPLKLQVGALSGQSIEIELECMDLEGPCLFPGLSNPRVELMIDDVNTYANATHEEIGETIKMYDDAIAHVSERRAYFGAITNRLEYTIANLDNNVENTQAAESRIRDADMADEMVEYAKNNILMQAGQAMLSQANQSKQGILSLLG